MYQLHPQSNKGISLIELMIAIVVAGIVATVAFRAFSRFSAQTAEQQRIAVTQDRLTRMTQLLEKDIRMTGYGLPGNGLHVWDNTAGNDSVAFYASETPTTTQLALETSAGGDTICVDDDKGAVVGQGVCLEDGDTVVYRKIAGFKFGDPCGDKVIIDPSLPSHVFEVDSTTVYFADRVSYRVRSGTLLRKRNGSGSSDMGGTIDALTVYALNDSSDTLTANFDSTRVLALSVESTERGISETVKAILRNFL